MPVTATQLRQDIYALLDQVAETGVPVDINRNGVLLRIIAVERAAPSRLARLENSKPSESIWKGDRDDIFKIDWMEGWPDRQDSN